MYDPTSNYMIFFKKKSSLNNNSFLPLFKVDFIQVIKLTQLLTSKICFLSNLKGNGKQKGGNIMYINNVEFNNCILMMIIKPDEGAN